MRANISNIEKNESLGHRCFPPGKQDVDMRWTWKGEHGTPHADNASEHVSNQHTQAKTSDEKWQSYGGTKVKFNAPIT